MNEKQEIRNFAVIAHVDHGKSTLCDRILEYTNAIEKRKMRDQVLDQMDLERERGITIKMQPITFNYKKGDTNYKIHLIDTPGHIDFSYEVSRALKAVEGALLIVDSTQGVQAQTLSVLSVAIEMNVKIIPVITKIDSPISDVKSTKEQIKHILDTDEVVLVSGKTGEGINTLIDTIIEKIPAPTVEKGDFKGLVFDYSYSQHKGVVLYVRVVSGNIKKGEELSLMAANKKFTAQEVGIFLPKRQSVGVLETASIGYISTGLKEPNIAKPGDTVYGFNKKVKAIEGFREPQPLIWLAIYPKDQAEFYLLKDAVEKLRLSDVSLFFEEDFSMSFGRGFQCGFLGMLHLDIILERLKREFNVEFVFTPPMVTYTLMDENNKEIKIRSPEKFPNEKEYSNIKEPWVEVSIITPIEYLNKLQSRFFKYEAKQKNINKFDGANQEITIEMPLRELMRNFFDVVKSITSGYASVTYKQIDEREAFVGKLDIHIAGELVPEFSRIVSSRRIENEAKTIVEKIAKDLPRRQFPVKIQALGKGRIISSETIPAFRKDVTAKLYGGDVTRKMKLLEKQKKGKKQMQQTGRVSIPHDVLIKILKNDESN